MEPLLETPPMNSTRNKTLAAFAGFAIIATISFSNNTKARKFRAPTTLPPAPPRVTSKCGPKKHLRGGKYRWRRGKWIWSQPRCVIKPSFWRAGCRWIRGRWRKRKNRLHYLPGRLSCEGDNSLVRKRPIPVKRRVSRPHTRPHNLAPPSQASTPLYKSTSAKRRAQWDAAKSERLRNNGCTFPFNIYAKTIRAFVGDRDSIRSIISNTIAASHWPNKLRRRYWKKAEYVARCIKYFIDGECKAHGCDASWLDRVKLRYRGEMTAIALSSKCPRGTELVGNAPPDGTSLGCVKRGGRTRHGIYVEFYREGPIRKILRLRNGKRHGKMHFFDKDGWREAVLSYRNGVGHGPIKIYFDNGKLKATYVKRNGKLHGPSVLYYRSGRKRMKGSYQKGKLHGSLYSYFESGQLQARFRLRYGRPVGRSRQWDRRGRLLYTCRYARGRENGCTRHRATAPRYISLAALFRSFGGGSSGSSRRRTRRSRRHRRSRSKRPSQPKPCYQITRRTRKTTFVKCGNKYRGSKAIGYDARKRRYWVHGAPLGTILPSWYRTFEEAVRSYSACRCK